MQGQESRLHERRSFEFEVEYSVISGFDMIRLIQARTLDFSLTGARIATADELDRGDKLSVRIELPDLNSFEQDEKGEKHYARTVIVCFGQVRWVEEDHDGLYHAGIRFSGMTVRDRAYLNRLLKEDTLQTEH